MTQLEIRLIRLDFPAPSGVFCTVYQNTKELGSISSTDFESPKNSLTVPSQGIIKIKVLSNTCLLGSVSFNQSLIPEAGCFWLPILPSGISDYIESLPEEQSSPKILLYFEKKSESSQTELEDTKSKLSQLSQIFQDFLKSSKSRELSLLQSLEEREQEIQDYLRQLNKAQDRIFNLIAEKNNLSEALKRLQSESNIKALSQVKAELESTRQELFKSESRTEALAKKLEELQSDWNFAEEETKHFKESEILTQLMQSRHDLDLKTQELALIKSLSQVHVFKNKPLESIENEMTDTIKQTKQCKANTYLQESNKSSFVLDEDHPHSQIASRGVSPGLKENFKKTPEIEKSKSSYKIGTIASNSKLKFAPFSASRKSDKSVERRHK